MKLKRIYRKASPDAKAKVCGVEIIDLPKNGTKNFSPNFIDGGQREGWLSKADGKVTIHAKGGDLVFKVIKEPGSHCLHCGETLPFDHGGEMSRKHVTENHKGVKSPDASHPSGYHKIHHFECAVEK